MIKCSQSYENDDGDVGEVEYEERVDKTLDNEGMCFFWVQKSFVGIQKTKLIFLDNQVFFGDTKCFSGYKKCS